MNEDDRLTASWRFREEDTVDPGCRCGSAAEHAERCERDDGVAEDDQ